MKLNPVILIIVTILAVYVGLNINKEQTSTVTNDEKNAVETTDSLEEKSVKKNSSESSGLTPEYLMKTLSENGFEIIPMYSGTTCDIYGGEMAISDSDITVQVDVYYERSSGEVLLVETNIDASGYLEYPNQKEVEDLVNKVAKGYFIQLVKIPYHGSDPDLAGEWVGSNLLTSYDDEPKEKTSTKIGPATINIFGDPLFRTLEMDFGFAD